MRKLLFIALIVVSSFSLFGQQDAMFTHYMFNTLSVNPGYAGSRDALTVTALHRSQWVGFDGAPLTQTLTMHTPVFRDNIGVGFSIINDKIGPVNVTAMYLDYSYSIKVTEKSNLAFGLKGGLNIRRNNLANLDIIDQADQSFMYSQQSMLLPNFGFGLYYSSDRYYAGVSVPKLLKNDFETNEVSGGTSFASEERHVFLIGGAVFDLNEDMKIKPTTFIKYTYGAPLEADLTGTLIFKDKFWGGLMFRTGDAVGLLFGVNIDEQLACGYSYDFSFGLNTGRYNSGSHEIMIVYDFIYKNKSKIRSPRYF